MLVQTGSAVLIPNTTSWLTGDGTYGPYAGGSPTAIGEYTARFPGTKGNSIKSFCLLDWSSCTLLHV